MIQVRNICESLHYEALISLYLLNNIKIPFSTRKFENWISYDQGAHM